MKYNSIIKGLLVWSSILLWSCSNTSIEGFDKEIWISDRWGCNSRRVAMAEQIILQKDKLRGKSQTEIRRILGKADQFELYERTQKFFHYYLTPGKNCNEADSIAKYLSIRFSPLDQASEIIILHE